MIKEDKILKSKLSTLIKKFSKNDVINDIEKEYQNSNAKQFSVASIDDNYYVKNAKISEIELKQIKESLLESGGMKSPLIIRPKKDHYEIVLGRKRLLASRLANMTSVPSVVINIDDEEMLLLLIASNRDERNANPIEMAYICQALKKNFNYTQQELGILTHQSRPQITNTMRLLNLPEDVQNDISMGKLSYGNAKAIVTLPETIIKEVVSAIYEHNLSVRETERVVKRYKKTSTVTSEEEEFINRKYLCKTMIKKKSVTISFNSEEEKLNFINSLIRK